MAFARQFGQAQTAASPWTSGAPPGLQQQPAQQVGQPVQPMFNQPMGAFDISGANWQGQQQAAAAAAAAQQWVTPMQQVQFVPNPAFLQQQHHHHQQQQQQQQMQHNQRPMHQRSLSAPRAGQMGLKRPMNQNNSFGGPQQHHNNWGQNRSQQNNSNSNNQFQNRAGRQQSRMNNQKGQFNNNQNSGHNNQYHNKNQQNQPKQQASQQQQQQQQQQQSNNNNKQPVRKVTKVKKLSAIKAKQQTNDVGGATTAPDAKNAPDGQGRIQSKTAERKQLKLQARKNAEALKQNKLPVAKATKGANDQSDATDSKVDEPIDQAQLKCVPAVFGFVCKLCDVFLRDKAARREHIDSNDHMEKFKVFEEEQQKVSDEKETDEAVKEESSDVKMEVSDAKVEVSDEKVSPDETVDEKVPSEITVVKEEKVASDEAVISQEEKAVVSDNKVNSDETSDEKVSSNETQ